MGLLITSIKAPYQGHLFMVGAASSCHLLSLPLCLSPFTSEGIEMRHKTSLFFIPEQLLSDPCKCAALLFYLPTEAHTSFSSTSSAFQDVRLAFLDGEPVLLFLNGMSLGIFSYKKRKSPKTQKYSKLRHCCYFLSVCKFGCVYVDKNP